MAYQQNPVSVFRGKTEPRLCKKSATCTAALLNIVIG